MNEIVRMTDHKISRQGTERGKNSVCVCVYVCAREREGEKDKQKKILGKVK